MSEFVDTVPTKIAVLRNGLQKALSFNRDTLSTISQIALHTDPESKLTMKIGFVVLLAGLYVCYLGLMVYLNQCIKTWHYELLFQYQSLRQEELEAQLAIYTYKNDFVSNHKFDEPAMLNQYFRASLKGVFTSNSMGFKSKAKPTTDQAKVGQTLTSFRRSGRLSKNHGFSSARILLLSLGLSLLIFVFFVSAYVVEDQRRIGLLPLPQRLHDLRQLHQNRRRVCQR